MLYPAYESRELTGTVLLRDQELMVKWKQASQDGGILARTVNGTNYSIVRDPALAEEIASLYGDGLTAYAFDSDANVVTPVASGSGAVDQAGGRSSGLERVRYASGPTGSDRDDGGNT